jgi:hypothetical protein
MAWTLMPVTPPFFIIPVRAVSLRTALLTLPLLAIVVGGELIACKAARADEDAWAFARPAEPAPTEADEGSASDTQPDRQQQDSQTASLPDPATIDWGLLNAGSTTLPNAPGRQPRATAQKSDAAPSAWSLNGTSDGFSALTVKQPVLPLWDTRVGADFNVAGPMSSPTPLPEKLATDGRLSQSSGAAWAAMTAPGLASVWDKTAIEARVDPSSDQSKIATSISKSVPLDGSAYALTLQSGYNVIEQGLVPVVGNLGRTARSYELDRSAKFDIANTGTSFLASQSLSTTDDKWLKSMGAEQKLFGGISVGGSVSETLVGNLNKSLTASFKTNW